ncbi:hypothetical protein HK102_000544, partial [Quaeritorhiza haematococci]
MPTPRSPPRSPSATNPLTQVFNEDHHEPILTPTLPGNNEPMHPYDRPQQRTLRGLDEAGVRIGIGMSGLNAERNVTTSATITSLRNEFTNRLQDQQRQFECQLQEQAEQANARVSASLTEVKELLRALTSPQTTPTTSPTAITPPVPSVKSETPPPATPLVLSTYPGQLCLPPNSNLMMGKNRSSNRS